MKGRILDRVVAAGREHRSVALATDLASGRQLLFDGDAAEGDLTLEDAALDRVREAWRTGRNRTIETAAGRGVHRSADAAASMLCRRCGAYRAAAGADAGDGRLRRDGHRPTRSVRDGKRGSRVSSWSQEWPDEALERLQPDRGSAIVALTHDPKLDDPALAAALRSECFYIGALGSRRNHAARCARLKELGFGDSDLARIHGPVGLAIGAISPAEVAISIIAEMTQILRRGEASEAA